MIFITKNGGLFNHSAGPVGLISLILCLSAAVLWPPRTAAQDRTTPVLALPADLSIIDLQPGQNGYRAGDSWSAAVTVKNVGSVASGPFSVSASLAHTLAITTEVVSLPDYEPTVYSLGTSAGLAPGESVTLTSPPQPISLLIVPGSVPIPDPSAFDANAGNWIPGLRNFSRIVLRATLMPSEPERTTQNHIAVTSFRYPVGLADPSYVPAQDGDGDGWEAGLDANHDCDDTNPEIYPGAVDVPNDGILNCCCGTGGTNPYYLPDNPAPGWQPDTQYPSIDEDGDGYPAMAYTPSETYTLLDDCNDAVAAIHPFAIERRNGEDDDCDRRVDEFVYFTGDLDEDGVRPGPGDCNDHFGAVRPGGLEVEDGLDNDCNGLVDEGFKTPDWTLNNFSVVRDMGWVDGPVRIRGLRWEATLGNVGDDLGPASLRTVARLAQLGDSSLTVIGNGTVGFAGFAKMPSDPTSVFELACDRATVILAAFEGAFGETNTTNNRIEVELEPTAIPVDIIAALPTIAYTRNSQNMSVVSPVRWEPGSCADVDDVLPEISVWVRVILNGELIHDVTESHSIGPGPTLGTLSVELPDRLHRLDEVRIDVVVGGVPAQDDPSNNRSTTLYRYRTPAFQQAHFELVSLD